MAIPVAGVNDGVGIRVWSSVYGEEREFLGNAMILGSLSFLRFCVEILYNARRLHFDKRLSCISLHETST